MKVTKAMAAALALKHAGKAIDTIYEKGKRPTPATDPGVELARAVVEYFGDEPIDPRLTSDLALKNFAMAIVAEAEARS